jgi:hypothetical protein
MNSGRGRKNLRYGSADGGSSAVGASRSRTDLLGGRRDRDKRTTARPANGGTGAMARRTGRDSASAVGPELRFWWPRGEHRNEGPLYYINIYSSIIHIFFYL